MEKRGIKDYLKEQLNVKKWSLFSKIYILSLVALIAGVILEWKRREVFILLAAGVCWLFLLLLFEIIMMDYKYWKEKKSK